MLGGIAKGGRWLNGRDAPSVPFPLHPLPALSRLCKLITERVLIIQAVHSCQEEGGGSCGAWASCQQEAARLCRGGCCVPAARALAGRRPLNALCSGLADHLNQHAPLGAVLVHSASKVVLRRAGGWAGQRGGEGAETERVSDERAGALLVLPCLMALVGMRVCGRGKQARTRSCTHVSLVGGVAGEGVAALGSGRHDLHEGQHEGQHEGERRWGVSGGLHKQQRRGGGQRSARGARITTARTCLLQWAGAAGASHRSLGEGCGALQRGQLPNAVGRQRVVCMMVESAGSGQDADECTKEERHSGAAAVQQQRRR